MINKVEAYRTEDGSTHATKEEAVRHLVEQIIAEKVDSTSGMVSLSQLALYLAEDASFRHKLATVIKELS